jgi:hypothetical protein
LTLKSLEQFEVGWSDQQRAFAFPERNSDGIVIGVHLRNSAGRKWSVRDSKRGLFIPKGQAFGEQVLVCEGLTDSVAMHARGFSVIGRSSCRGSVAHLQKWARIHAPLEFVVVADNDPDGQGLSGAQDLAAQLCLYVPSVRVIQPPDGIKDARSWVNAGATIEDIEQAINMASSMPLTVRVSTS